MSSLARHVLRDPVLPPMAVLSPAALQRFAESGFVTLPGLCAAEEVAEMRAILLGQFERHVGRDEGTQFDMLGLDVDGAAPCQPQIIKPSTFAPDLLRTHYFEQLFVAARQLLGRDAQFSFDHSILKPAHSAAPTPWHQDEAHHLHKYLRYPQVSFWMPLQDTPVEAGCMRYIPGSNHGPLWPHHWLHDDPRIHAAECSAEHVDEAAAVAVPIAAGSCIAHDGRTLHSALPNVSAMDRLAYIVAFTAQPVLAGQGDVVHLVSTQTANIQRRAHWLRHGGFLIYGVRRLRQGLRSSPGALWLKVRLLARAVSK